MLVTVLSAARQSGSGSFCCRRHQRSRRWSTGLDGVRSAYVVIRDGPYTDRDHEDQDAVAPSLRAEATRRL